MKRLVPIGQRIAARNARREALGWLVAVLLAGGACLGVFWLRERCDGARVTIEQPERAGGAR